MNLSNKRKAEEMGIIEFLFFMALVLSTNIVLEFSYWLEGKI